MSKHDGSNRYPCTMCGLKRGAWTSDYCTGTPPRKQEEGIMTNREYIQWRGEEAAAFAYERERAAGFTPAQASALAKAAADKARHLARHLARLVDGGAG